MIRSIGRQTDLADAVLSDHDLEGQLYVRNGPRYQGSRWYLYDPVDPVCALTVTSAIFEKASATVAHAYIKKRSVCVSAVAWARTYVWCYHFRGVITSGLGGHGVSANQRIVRESSFVTLATRRKNSCLERCSSGSPVWTVRGPYSPLLPTRRMACEHPFTPSSVT